MSTRSVIILKRKEGDYKSISCHWDGYPTYVGALLMDHYNSYDKANELTELGDLSTLKETITTSQFYGRDRGETRVGFRITKTIDESLSYRDYEYIYKFEDGTWYVARWDDYDKDTCEYEWHPIEDVINNEYNEYGVEYKPNTFYGYLCEDTAKRLIEKGILQKRA